MERKNAIIGSEKQLNIEDDYQEIKVKKSKKTPTICKRDEIFTYKNRIFPQFSNPKIRSNIEDYINLEEVKLSISPNQNINLQIPKIFRCLKCECLTVFSLFLDHFKTEVSDLGDNYKKVCSSLNPYNFYTIILIILNMNGDFINLLNDILNKNEGSEFFSEIQKFKHFILALMATIKNQDSKLPPYIKHENSPFTVWAAGFTSNNNIELFKQKKSFMILDGFRLVHFDKNKALKNVQLSEFSCIYELIINKEDSPNVLTSAINYTGIDDSDLYVLNTSLMFSFKDYPSKSKDNLIIRAEIMSTSYYQKLQRRINNRKMNQVPLIDNNGNRLNDEFEAELSNIELGNHTPNHTNNEIFPNLFEEEKVEDNNINPFNHEINRLILYNEMNNELDKTGPTSFVEHNSNIHFPPADSQIEGNMSENGSEIPSYKFN
jgi:hypothetical protein